MEEGRQVHDRARSLFPNGEFAGRVDETKALLTDEDCDAIFEAAFKADGFSARADILKREACGKWCVIEIKSGVHSPGRYKPDYLDDLAYTVMVFRRAGIDTTNSQLMLLSPDWRLGMPERDLFVMELHPRLLSERVAEFEALADEIRDIVLDDKMPDPVLNYECRKCRFFADRCIGRGVEYPIFDLPRLSEQKIESLGDANILDLRDISDETALTDNQQRIRAVIESGQPAVDVPALQALLAQVQWPAGYLDFETFKAAIPVWPDVAPHEQIATQYSLHVCDEPGAVRDHSQYLADPSVDCRRELAQRLISDTAGLGSIVSYSPFEGTTIRRLAEHFQDLSKPLESIADRLFDLEMIFKGPYVHPEFRGKTSIKRTLPVLVPGMGYDELSISDGDAAIAAFGRLMQSDCAEDESQRIRENLLEYCKQDTLAMVRLHAAVAEKV